MIEPVTLEKAALIAANGETYKDRVLGEYWFTKIKYDRLHAMIIRREAGKLDFEPNCSMELWRDQASAMGRYLYLLEIRAAIAEIDLDDGYFGKTEARNES